MLTKIVLALTLSTPAVDMCLPQYDWQDRLYQAELERAENLPKQSRDTSWDACFEPDYNQKPQGEYAFPCS
ncbi:hypothetical protein CL620_03105 [archaeon]|nr:hypothetical protein [archaeon]|tara:strand:+ start:1047 stop:1259 length:213 start_codon:yes stop_codon:yes gene_type:complete